MTPRAVMAAAGLAAVTAPALAGPIEVIFCKKGGDPKAAIAGWLDHTGAPIAVEFRSMNQAYVAADGSQWMIAAQSTADSFNDIGFVYGTGLTGAALSVGGHTFVEGRPAPLAVGTAGFMEHTGSTSVVNWNSAGHMAFGFSVRPNQGSGTSNERRIFVKNGSSLTYITHTGDQYVGHATAGAPVGTSINNYHILDDGRVGLLDSNSPSPTPSSQRPVASYSPAGGGPPEVLIHNGQQVLDIDGVTPIALSGMGANDFITTRNGSHWYATGTVGGISGPVVFLRENPGAGPRGMAVLKSNTEIDPGSGMYPTRSTAGFLNTILLENGDWYLRGNFANTPDNTTSAGQYLAKNGNIIVKPGDPITPASSETWTTVGGIAANNAGDYIVFGVTNGPVEANDVAVLNGTTVVLREGDPVDLDGNGQFDDNAWIGRGNNTLASLGSGQWTLTENNYLYGVVMLRDGAVSGNDINTTVTPAFGTPQAFIRKLLDTGPAPCYANCDESTTAPVLNVGDFTCFLQRFAAGESYANCDNSTTAPVLNVGDFTCFLQQFAAGCP